MLDLSIFRNRMFAAGAAGLSDRTLAPFVHNIHTALRVLAATSMVGAAVSLMRPTGAAERLRAVGDGVA